MCAKSRNTHLERHNCPLLSFIDETYISWRCDALQTGRSTFYFCRGEQIVTDVSKERAASMFRVGTWGWRQHVFRIIGSDITDNTVAYYKIQCSSYSQHVEGRTLRIFPGKVMPRCLGLDPDDEGGKCPRNTGNDLRLHGVISQKTLIFLITAPITNIFLNLH